MTCDRCVSKYTAVSIESDIIKCACGAEISIFGIFTQLKYPPTPFVFEIINRGGESDTVSDSGNWLVLEPSICIPPTFIANAGFCLRNAILTYYSSAPQDQFPFPLVCGSAVHHYLQTALKNGTLPSSIEKTLLISETILESISTLFTTDAPSDKDLIAAIKDAIPDEFVENILRATDELISNELRVHEHGISGSIDCVARGTYGPNYGTTFLEIKSGKESQSNRLQLAAYSLAKPLSDHYSALIYTKTGTIKPVNIETGAIIDVIYLRHTILYHLLTKTFPPCTQKWCKANTSLEANLTQYEADFNRLYEQFCDKFCGRRISVEKFTIEKSEIVAEIDAASLKIIKDIRYGVVKLEFERNIVSAYLKVDPFNENKIRLSLVQSDVEEIYTSKKFTLFVQLSFSDVSMELGALISIVPPSNKAPSKNEEDVIEPEMPLSSEQMKIYNAVYNHGNRIVVKGYPGSGKSHLITAVVKNALYREQKVLLLAPTNLAVDALLDSINHTDYIREGIESSVDEKHRSHMLKFSETGNPRSRLASAYSAIKKAKSSLLVASTIHSYFNRQLPASYNPDLIVIDEVGKVPWYITNYICTNASRVLLVGDPTQIGPLSGAKSIFSSNWPSLSIKTQYRMNSKLLQRFNELFDLQLICGYEEEEIEDAVYNETLYFIEGGLEQIKTIKMRFTGAMLLAPYNIEADMIGGMTIDKAQGLTSNYTIVWLIDKGGDHLSIERICVALSRAKRKTFVIGKSDTLNEPIVRKLIDLCKKNNTYIS